MRKSPTPAVCGTKAGRERHVRKREEPCAPCRAAKAKYDRDRRGSLNGMRLPSKPLFDYLRINLEHQDETLELLAERLDVSYDALVRAHYQGHLSFGFADTVAIRLGLHPCLIWGDLWWQDTVLDPGYEGALADAA